MATNWPTAVLVHTPTHASWLHQIEVVFSAVARKVISCGDFADLDALGAAITAFQAHYNATAAPFDWRYTRTDLLDLLTRLAAHEPTLLSGCAPAPTLDAAAAA